ncbi:MAG TPA: cation diffusion facilitator family transporter [Gaiella sp.]|nr:cation diffusion facilitator family transporter [Gaiella sp.]
MTPQRRTALVSVVAAAVLIGIKLVTGLAAGSLGLVADAAHSGTDLVAALLTFFAVGWATKPADAAHLYGHGKAEHLAALAEAAFLILVSLGVAALAVARLAGWVELDVDPAWWAFAALGVVVAIDLARTVVSYRAAQRYTSAALLSNAVHFGSDLLATVAVIGGLVAARAGFPEGDSLAALFVAALVVAAAVRLIRRNVDVLMDRAPADAVDAAQEAIARLEPPVVVRRLRLRQVGGRTFADVVIGVSPGAAVGQGHAAADRVEDAVERALPGSDVVVHVEPAAGEAELRERVRAAAMAVSHVRELHDLALIDTADGIEASLHVKLPGDLPLAQAHEIAENVEDAIHVAAPEVRAVQTHLEPLAERAPGRVLTHDPGEVERAVVAVTGSRPRELRTLDTQDGLVVLVTLALPGSVPLAKAHDEASAVSERIRAALPGVAAVVVHTEP